MASVWFIGRAAIRSISAKEWAAAGIAGEETTVWRRENGWSIPVEQFSEAQIRLLSRDHEFNTEAPDGPRPDELIFFEPDIAASKAWVAEYIARQFADPTSPAYWALNSAIETMTIDCGSP